jgi:hypothetical protein
MRERRDSPNCLGSVNVFVGPIVKYCRDCHHHNDQYTMLLRSNRWWPIFHLKSWCRFGQKTSPAMDNSQHTSMLNSMEALAMLEACCNFSSKVIQDWKADKCYLVFSQTCSRSGLQSQVRISDQDHSVLLHLIYIYQEQSD